jgi:hypothetical protein
MDNNYQEKAKGVQEYLLKLYNPMHYAVVFVFYSPLIISAIVTSLSFPFQNGKGFIYLAYLLVSSSIRSFFYEFSGLDIGTGKQPGDICDSVQNSKYGNSTYSSFVFAFTIFYLSIPMFVNNTINYAVLIGLIAYSMIDLLMRQYKNCYKYNNVGELFFNVLAGSILAICSVSIMYMIEAPSQLFFNELSSTKEICSQPTEQTFKCQVYKNGELLGDYAS